MILYVSLSIRYYNQYRRRIFEELSYADTVLFNWIRRFLITLLAILTLRILFLIFLPEWGSFGTKFWYYLLFAVLAYYIALMGYTQVLESVVPLRLLALKPKEPPLPEAKAEPPANPSPILPDLDKGKTQVRSLMEEQRLYENPTLTLTDLAGALGITTKQTSALVNQGFGMNFNDFVNHYRVEAVKERLARGEHEKFTLLGIALACGFNSKSTFNRVFKRDTSLTPGQYLAQLEKRSAKS
jgi:AraC-like DNA-binding protein